MSSPYCTAEGDAVRYTVAIDALPRVEGAPDHVRRGVHVRRRLSPIIIAAAVPTTIVITQVATAPVVSVVGPEFPASPPHA